MPTIYAKHHDKFIENYLSNFEEKALTSERLVMAKTKTNYVIPLYLNIKVKLLLSKGLLVIFMIFQHIPSIMNNLQFMATMKIEKIYKISAFMIIDQNEGIVQNISSGCIIVIGLDNSGKTTLIQWLKPKRVDRNQMKKVLIFIREQIFGK